MKIHKTEREPALLAAVSTAPRSQVRKRNWTTAALGFFLVAFSLFSANAQLVLNAPAQFSSRVGPNVLIGEARTDPPSELRAQAEPHLARSLSDRNLVVATFRESSNFSLGNTDEGYAVSRDGGRSWSAKTLLSIGQFDGGLWKWARLGVAAIDPKNNLVLMASAWNTGRTPSSENFLFNSMDGTNFIPHRLPTLPNNSSEFTGRQWLAVNAYAHTAHGGRLFAVWDGQNQQSFLGLRTTYSDDGGGSWSPLRKLTSDDLDAYPQALYLPDGSLAVFYFHGPDLSGEIRMLRSADGGDTFGSAITAAQVDFVDAADPAIGDLWYYSGVVAAGDQLAGVLYLTWATMLDDGSTRSKRIMFSRSIDKGRTWTRPVPVNDTPQGRQVLSPQIAVSPDGQHVTITFYDRRNDPGADDLLDLYLAESLDGGDTWQPNLRISDVSSDTRLAFDLDGGLKSLGYYFGLVPSLNLATPGVACWIDTRTGYPRAFTAQIERTRGTTFETWRKLRWGTNDLANLSISGPAADPDGDGIPNLAEYACGLEPNHPDNKPLFAIGPTSPNDPFMRLTLTHPSTSDDIEFLWEQSTDLIHWAKAGLYPKHAPPPSEPPPFWQDDYWVQKVEPSGNKFVRLVVKPRAQ